MAAAGQATTQSQRLAKSVSQALAGIATSFPELQESSAVLARNVRGLKDGNADIAAVSGGLQDAVQQLLPLVERAETSAATASTEPHTATS